MGGRHSITFFYGSSSTRPPSRGGVSTLFHASRFAVAFRIAPCPAYASRSNASDVAAVDFLAPPAGPTPEVPLAVASAAPATGSAPSSLRVNAQGIDFLRICVGAHNRASKPEGVRIYRRHRCVCHCWPRSPPSPVLFNEPSKARAIILPQRSPRRRAVQRLRRRQHCWPHTLSLCRRHTSSPRLGNATFRVAVAVAAAAFIAIATAIVTVATTTMAPRSAFSFAPQRSPSAGELVSGCAGASIIGRVRPRFAIAQRHLIAPPRQRDLSRRCRRRYRYRHRHRHRHSLCGHHHQGATQRRTQPTGQRHCAAGGSGGTGRQAVHCGRDRGMTLTVFAMLYSCSTK